MDYQIYENKHSGGFITASLILGTVGIATGCCVYTAIICGALAVMFALLSRGSSMIMSSKAKMGFGLGIAAIIAGIFMLIMAFITVIIQFGSFENYMDFYFDLLNGNGIPQSL